MILTLDHRVKIAGLGLWHARAGAHAPGAELDLDACRAYAAPELVRGDPPTAAADVYSAGAILRDLAGAAAPPPVQALVRRCLERDPAVRIPDGRTLARELAWLVARAP